MKKRVVITGLGFASSIGNSSDEVEDSLRNARSGIAVFPELPQEGGNCILAGVVRDFDLSSSRSEDWTYPSKTPIERTYLRSMGPHVVYACHAMDQAIAQAGLKEDHISNPRSGASCSSGGSMSVLYNNQHLMETKGVRYCLPFDLPAGIPGTLNFNLAAKYKLKGSVVGLTSACASSSHAMGYAYDQIMLGRQDLMFVVGAEDCNRLSMYLFASVRALSTRTDPTITPSPFDAERDGFVATGGAATLVLESLESAQARGARILAEVLGWGEAADGYNVIAPEPKGDGLARAMKLALASAGLAASDVDYLNAHATGTAAGDQAEIHATRTVFHTGRMPWISSTKALTGHALSMAGALEAAICVLALTKGFMPVSAKITRLDPAFHGVPILTRPEPHAPSVAMSNSSGFGGSNVSLIFRRWSDTDPA